MHRPVGVDLVLQGGLDGLGEAGAHGGQLEVHARPQRLHVPAGHQRAVVAADDPGQRVQGGVGAHQREAALPVQPAAHLGPGRRRLTLQQQHRPAVAALHAEHGQLGAPEL